MKETAHEAHISALSHPGNNPPKYKAEASGTNWQIKSSNTETKLSKEPILEDMSALCKSLKLKLHSVEQQTSNILSDLEVETKRKQEFYIELKRYISFEEPTVTKYSEITQHIINFERMKKGTTTCSEENSRVRAEHNFDSES